MNDGEVNLLELTQICPMSAKVIDMWAEAAVVMLSKFHQVPPPGTAMKVEWEPHACKLHVHWAEPTRVALDSHANENDATEDGAYAIAIAIAHHAQYVVRKRMQHRSGADLLMVRRGDRDEHFIKLEVSGIARAGSMPGRLHIKEEQVAGGNVVGPGVALVVHFEGARIIARGP